MLSLAKGRTLLQMNNYSNLEEENKRLKATIKQFENQKKEKWSKRYRMTKSLSGKFLGTKLKNAIHAFFTELQEDKTVSKDTASDLLAALFMRVTRIGVFVIVTSLLPTLLIILQVYYLKNQNRLITGQNSRMKQQTFLQEAERRSFMIGILDQIINEVTSEAYKNNGYIGKQSATRLIAISKNLKPYRYLENDELIDKSVSPERGYLLLSMLENNIKLSIITDSNTKQTLGEALNFEYAELRNANITDLNLDNINLDHSDLQGSNFQISLIQGKGTDGRKSSFRHANLKNAVFDKCTLKHCDFSYANLEHTSFAKSEIDHTLFNEANLKNVDFSYCDLTKVNFTNATILQANFNNATVSNDFIKMMKDQLNSENYDYLDNNYQLKINKNNATLILK